jgi:hypothetical protein
MEPLITNGIDPALLRVLEKRGQERDPLPRRKRPGVAEKAIETEENSQEPGLDTPQHKLDDLA